LHSDDDNDKKVKPSMTAAGVATLFITQDYVHADAGIDCRGNIHSPSLEAGLKWMGDNFSLIKPDGDYYDYTLYGVERIGVASGYKYFGSVDWYARGSETLLASKAKPISSAPTRR
jgi:hypothetical protein